MSDIKVLLVEDHIMTRMGMSLVIEKADGISLVGEAEDGKVAIEKAKEFLPDLVLMDIGALQQRNNKLSNNHPPA